MRWALDPHFLDRAGSGVILCICAMHLYLVALLIGWPDTQGSTSIIAMLNWAVLPGYGAGLLIIEILIAASLAIVGTLHRLGWARIGFFLPQHYLLGVMAYGGFAATFHGAYLDHTAMPWPHISADQFGFTTLFAIHSWAIYRRSRDPNG